MCVFLFATFMHTPDHTTEPQQSGNGTLRLLDVHGAAGVLYPLSRDGRSVQVLHFGLRWSLAECLGIVAGVITHGHAQDIAALERAFRSRGCTFLPCVREQRGDTATEVEEILRSNGRGT